MNKADYNQKILITGAKGFVGQSLVQVLEKKGYLNLITPNKYEYDLRSKEETFQLFEKYKPKIVFHLAGKVGGIGINSKNNGEFFHDNILIGTNILEVSRKSNVKKTIALAAGCGYPESLKAPFKEEDFWNGLPDKNSIGYSMAKKMLIIQSWTYREQYGFDSTVLLPANLYGPFDNFSIENSHVIPALVRKFVEAKKNNAQNVTIWGSGKASREFLYVDDLSHSMVKILEKKYNKTGPLNIGTGKETTILELVNILKEITNFNGKIIWDKDKPDGQLKRYYDMAKFKKEVGKVKTTSIESGLKKTVIWFKKNINNFTDK